MSEREGLANMVGRYPLLGGHRRLACSFGRRPLAFFGGIAASYCSATAHFLARHICANSQPRPKAHPSGHLHGIAFAPSGSNAKVIARVPNSQASLLYRLLGVIPTVSIKVCFVHFLAGPGHDATPELLYAVGIAFQGLNNGAALDLIPDTKVVDPHWR